MRSSVSKWLDKTQRPPKPSIWPSFSTPTSQWVTYSIFSESRKSRKKAQRLVPTHFSAAC